MPTIWDTIKKNGVKYDGSELKVFDGECLIFALAIKKGTCCAFTDLLDAGCNLSFFIDKRVYIINTTTKETFGQEYDNDKTRSQIEKWYDDYKTG